MTARLMLIAVSALGLASMASAEPDKAPAPTSAGTQGKDRPVLLAAAEVNVAPSPLADTAGAPPAAPAKKRTARVTSCRCGDSPNP